MLLHIRTCEYLGDRELYLELYDGRFFWRPSASCIVKERINEILLVYFFDSYNINLVDCSLHVQIGAFALWCGVLGELNNIQTFVIDVCHLD